MLPGIMIADRRATPAPPGYNGHASARCDCRVVLRGGCRCSGDNAHGRGLFDATFLSRYQCLRDNFTLKIWEGWPERFRPPIFRDREPIGAIPSSTRAVSHRRLVLDYVLVLDSRPVPERVDPAVL